MTSFATLSISQSIVLSIPVSINLFAIYVAVYPPLARYWSCNLRRKLPTGFFGSDSEVSNTMVKVEREREQFPCVPIIVRRRWCHKQILAKGCRHSSVDSSAPTILPPWVWAPSTPSTLLSFIVFVLYLSCEKNENKEKEVWFGPFKHKQILADHRYAVLK